MESMLLIVTLVALTLAVAMAGLAWKLLREDRRRAAARVEALVAGAEIPEPPDPPVAPFSAPPPASDRFVSLDEDAVDDAAIETTPTRAPRPAPAVLFGTSVRPTASTGRWLALTAISAIMAVCLVAAYVRHRPFVAVGLAAEAASAAAGPGGAARPLELLSLRHATDPDGTFTVTGLVQNPSGGQTARNVMAVVYLFDRDGNYVAGAKAALDFTTIQPGDESPFVVRVTNAARISRYRVGFRSEAGGVIAHVDRRGQVPASTTGDAIDAPGESRPPGASAPRPGRPEGRP